MSNNVVSLAKIERMVEKIKRDNPLINNWENYLVPFEYVCASLFPTCYQNITETMNNQYTKGYIQGLEDGKNET